MTRGRPGKGVRARSERKARLHADTRKTICWRGSAHAYVSGRERRSLQQERWVARDMHLLPVRRSLVSCQTGSVPLPHVQHEKEGEDDESCCLSWKARRAD